MNEKVPSTVELGNRIWAARKAKGWSQHDLAERAGVSRPTIARIEGGTDVSTVRLAKITEALGLEIKLEEKPDSAPPDHQEQ